VVLVDDCVAVGIGLPGSLSSSISSWGASAALSTAVGV
jgi:hypothetical protein